MSDELKCPECGQLIKMHLRAWHKSWMADIGCGCADSYRPTEVTVFNPDPTVAERMARAAWAAMEEAP